MKKRKITIRLSIYSLLFFLAGLMLSCNEDDDFMTMEEMEVPEETTTTIADLVAGNDNYSVLLTALQRADLATTLAGDGPFTVFAPTNAAFSSFLEANGFSALEDIPDETLQQVLLNHVLSGEVMSSDISTGYVSTLATNADNGNNLSMYLNTDSGVTINGTATVTQADIEADNGVIHEVDAVIGLPTIVTFATADATFSNLVAALTREDGFTYVSTLSMMEDPAPFTVFAPTNNAFGSLIEELDGVESLDDIPTETLQATLNMHVIAGAQVLSTDLSSGTVSTLGGDVEINADDASITDANGRVSNIIATDVQAANGVIHAIDTVILPEL